ncbi:MAG: hypothetical protein ACLPY1_18095 [Terracidiphilus sp.]
MRSQEIEMKQGTYMPSESTSHDSDPAETPHTAHASAPHANGASEYGIGTPEHAELVDAVRREFPEIFDPGANCGNAECS